MSTNLRLVFRDFQNSFDYKDFLKISVGIYHPIVKRRPLNEAPIPLPNFHIAIKNQPQMRLI